MHEMGAKLPCNLAADHESTPAIAAAFGILTAEHLAALHGEAPEIDVNALGRFL